MSIPVWDVSDSFPGLDGGMTETAFEGKLRS